MLKQASRTGLAYDSFWRCTLNDFEAWMEGWALREEDEWKRLRMLYGLIFNVNSTKKMDYDELIPLPSDKPIVLKIKKLNIDEAYKMAEKYKLNFN